jgi:hypothetical protein
MEGGTGKVTIETLQRLVDVFNAHDVDAVMGFFTTTRSWSCPAGRIRGGGGSWGGRPSERGWPVASPASPTSTTAMTVTGSAATGATRSGC